MKVRLWYISETANAYLYCRLPPERHPGKEDELFIPKSQVEHRTKWSATEHELTIPDWLADAKGL